MYTHAQRHTYTHIQTHVYTHTGTYRHTYTQIHVHTHTYIHTHTHVRVHTHKQTQVHTRVHTRSHRIKSCSTSLFTHRAGYCTLGGGREHSTHSLLCFHCAQLLTSLTAPSANDRSGLSSEPPEQDGPGGHTRPHHNFHSPLASRRVEISSPASQAPL
ncbi:unnamed protein product, partial [Staurois parvus]